MKQISRRSLVGGLAMGCGLVATGTALVAGSRPLYAASRRHTVKVGDASITIFSDGIFTLPRRLALPGTEASAVDGVLKAAGMGGEFVLQINVALVRSGMATVLVDAGAGTEFLPSLGKLTDALEESAVKPDGITHVAFTHAHADHLWGVIDPFGEGTRWPKARHVMMAAERDYWLTPGIENKVPDHLKGTTMGSQRRLKDLGDVVRTVRDGEEIAPGISVHATPGHTPGHACFIVRSGSEEAIIGGDAVTHAAISFAEPGWKWGPDTDWQLAAQTRTKLLDSLAHSKALLIGYHLPWPGIGRVEKAGKAYRFVPA